MSEVDAQTVLDDYLNDPRLLSELRFWNSNQGVAVKLIANNKLAVTAMLKRMEKEKAK